MKEIRLSSKEKLQLEKRHKAGKNKLECDRIKAVLLHSEGWTSAMISQALRIHETTVNRHINDYECRSKLKPENGGSESALTVPQTFELVEHLESHTYQYAYEIIAHIKKLYGIAYSVPGMNKWLHRQGFSYKKTKGHPHKADKQEQQNFIKKYKRLKKQLNSDEIILFMDAVHPSQATKLSYGWIKTGETKGVHTSASRTRVNLVGAINLDKLSHFQVFEYDTINTGSIVHFLGHVREQNPGIGKIHLILDCAGYHRAFEVKNKAKKMNIKLHYLPPYSPNLNPIERLWKVMNEHARNNQFFKSPKDFRGALFDFFKSTLPTIHPSLLTRINDKFQIL